jgi:hypothetical protein
MMELVDMVESGKEEERLQNHPYVSSHFSCKLVAAGAMARMLECLCFIEPWKSKY